MATDRAKLTKSAQKHLAKGNLDKAIVDYEKLVAADPADSRSLLKLGDLYTKKGAVHAACETYRRVATQYGELGFFLKAVAVYKQILKLDPSQLDAWEQLAEMYELLTLTSDAITTYEQVADAYENSGKPYKALHPLARIAALDPDNVAACIRYAEALSKARRIDEAVVEFERGAQLLIQQDRVDDYIKVSERLLYHRPDHVEKAHELAEVYLEQGEARHALAKLQPCFKADPKNIATLSLLARAFSDLGQTAKTLSVYHEISRLHGAAGDIHEQLATLQAIVAMAPEDAEARHQLALLSGETAAAPSSPYTYVSEEPVGVPSEDDNAVTAVGDDDSGVVAVSDSGARSRPGENLDEDTQAQIERLMTECEVFIKYGLTDKVEAQLRAVLTVAPSHVDARVKLAEHYMEQGYAPEAAEQWLAAADAVRNHDLNLAIEYCTLAVQQDPENPAAKEALQALAEVGGRAPYDESMDDEDIIILGDEDDVSVIPLDEETHQHVMDQGDTQPSAVLPQPEDEEEDPGAYRDAPLAPGPGLAAPPPVPAQPRPAAAPGRVALRSTPAPQEFTPAGRAGAGEASDLGTEPDPFFDTPVTTESERPYPARALEDEAPASEELHEFLEELDFYLSQSMVDEAGETLADALEHFPEHPALLAKQAELAVLADSGAEHARSSQGTTATPGSSGFEVDDQSFALAEKLAAEASQARSAQGSEAIDVNDVIDQFRAGVRVAVDPDDAATHYDLGIAYMEMGLHTEAIEEFRLCLDESPRRCQAHTMIGLSYVSNGDMENAVQHFKNALTHRPNPREQLDLWFEIGNAYELLGRQTEALVYYEKVEEVDPTYRNVGERVERLGVPASEQQEEDEFDEMFDNMILKE